MNDDGGNGHMSERGLSPSPIPYPPPPALGVVADDLTGAVDTGVQFARHGLQTLIQLDEGEIPPAEVVVVTTDSRDEPAVEAYSRARAAAARVRGRVVYKKIDSTFRGNVGPELEGLMEGLEIGRALVAPAFPATGRTTIGGIHLVNGVPLADSAFAKDPLWPATESHLVSILGRQTHCQVGHLPLEVVQRGPEAVAEALRSETSPIVVADAASVEHLAALARGMISTGESWLPCGSAGFAEEIPGALGLDRTCEPFRWPSDPRPVLVVAGSRHQATAAQLRRAAQAGSLLLVELTPGERDEEMRQQVDAALAEGRCVAITTTFSPYREGMGKAAADWLGREAARVVENDAISGLFLTGGDIARALCAALGASALRALGEVEPGVAVAALSGGPRDGLRVVTKAGGFGTEEAVLRSIDCLRGLGE